MIRFAAAAVIVGVVASPLFANQIERACLQSDRAGTNRAVCGCIQDAANLTLTSKDQRLAATFFRNPDRAQEIRQSSQRGHTTFWQRYRNFGQTAELFCQG